MKDSIVKIFGLAFLLCALVYSVSAQIDIEKLVRRYSCTEKSQQSVRDYFDGLEAQQKQIADAERKLREFQIAQFGEVSPKISGHCWNGCPTRLVKPYYPQEAKHHRIFGQVIIKTIADENGKVIYAQPQKGNILLVQVSRQAACLSHYTSQRFAGKPMKFGWIITYNFILN